MLIAATAAVAAAAQRSPVTLFLVVLSAAVAAAAPGSLPVSELLGRPDRRPPPPPPPASAADAVGHLSRPDPYDEYAEPRRFDWPAADRRRRRLVERIRRGILWRIAGRPDFARRQRQLERLGPLRPHARDSRLDRPDPYREFATEAYYRFVRAILDMRNRMTILHDFDKTSAIREFFEELLPPPSNGSAAATTPAPSPDPEATPSPPVKVCPPKWRLGDLRCEANATSCFKDADCPDSRCCFDGCKLRCLEPELLVRHVCRDYMNSSVFPGDLYMHKKTQICTCDELGRPVGCKDKKPCIEIISSSLFKLPFISEKTVKLKKRERTTRQKIYDALQKAFKHVKKVY